jgi:selenocysteine lyase/cysteine desulfurase
MELLQTHVFGNPHSTNPSSMAMTELIEKTRRYVLEFFNADPEEYLVIFTPNATGALKLVGESYPWVPGSTYLLTFDNHNSVNGIREFARHYGVVINYVPLVPPDLRVDERTLATFLEQRDTYRPNLFAYPAQSNFSGAQHPLEWVEQAHALGWDVLLDAAAFTPSNRLDLSRWHPDFVDLSFYKIFGYPTGIGALIARREKLAKLRRPWYAGGTITFSSVQAAPDLGEGYYLTPGEAGFEDGTVNYLGIPAIEIGLRHIASIGIDTIHTRVSCLTGWLLENLLALRHSNGAPVIRLYGPATNERRGGTVTFNFHDPDGHLIDCRTIQAEANEVDMSVRSGCHCNPGVREVALGFSEDDLAACFRDKERMTYDQFMQVIDGKTTGAVRVSVGLASTFADIYRFYEFARIFIDQRR